MITALCNVLGIEKPLLSAPLGGAAGPELVAAVSNAGGYGVIPLWGGPADEVRDGIRRTCALTDRNFAVNLNVSVDYRAALQVCIDEGVHAVSLFWGHEPDAIDTAKAGGLVVLATVGTAAEAKVAQAAGVWVGTRFLAAPAAKIHETYRQAILAASGEQAEWYADLYDGHWRDAPHRALRNATSEGWRGADCPASGLRPDEGQVVGSRPGGGDVRRYDSYTPRPGTTGDVGAMSLWSGQGVGLVHEVKGAACIVDEICNDARRIVASKSADLKFPPGSGEP